MAACLNSKKEDLFQWNEVEIKNKDATQKIKNLKIFKMSPVTGMNLSGNR